MAYNPQYPSQQYPPQPQPMTYYYTPSNPTHKNIITWKWRGGIFKAAVITILLSIAIPSLNPSTINNGGVFNVVAMSIAVAIAIAVFDGITYE
jgi:uncharacterized membrane protein